MDGEKRSCIEAYKLLHECFNPIPIKIKPPLRLFRVTIRTTARMENLVAMRADGEISKSNFKVYAIKRNRISALNEELAKLNSVSDEAAQALDMDAIEAALNEVLDFQNLKSAKA